MPVIKPTLTASDKEQNQKRMTDLIYQLKRAKGIHEPIHLGPFKEQKEGKSLSYDYDTLIKTLESLDLKVAPDPFLLQLAYAAIGQKTVSESSGSVQFFNAQEKSVDSILNSMSMLPNPVLLMLIRSLTYDLCGEPYNIHYVEQWMELPLGSYRSPSYFKHCDPFMRASYPDLGLKNEYGIKKTQVKRYESMPEGMWPIEGILKWHDAPEELKAKERISLWKNWKDPNIIDYGPIRFELDYLSKYSELIGKQIKDDIGSLYGLQDGSSGRKRAYKYIASTDEVSKRLSSPHFNHMSPGPAFSNWSSPDFSDPLLSRFPEHTNNFFRAILTNERWFKNKNYQYAYYFRYLFKAYKAYDAYEKTYQDIRNKQSLFSKRLPIEPLQAMKAVKKHLFNRLMILAEIKLENGWDEVVNKGMRVDLKDVFGDLFDKLQETPSFSCMKKLFQSDAWIFLQGKFANAIIYYQKNPNLMNADDFDVLSEFASHLLQHHSDMIKKDLKQQIIVLGIVLSIVAAGLSVAAAPSGPIAHIAAGSAEAMIITEFVLGFVHLSHGLHEAFDQIKHLQLTGNQLPLNELHQDTQERVNEEMISSAVVNEEENQVALSHAQ